MASLVLVADVSTNEKSRAGQPARLFVLSVSGTPGVDYLLPSYSASTSSSSAFMFPLAKLMAFF